MDREQIKFLMDPRQAAPQKECEACGSLFRNAYEVRCGECRYGSSGDGPTMNELYARENTIR